MNSFLKMKRPLIKIVYLAKYYKNVSLKAYTYVSKYSVRVFVNELWTVMANLGGGLCPTVDVCGLKLKVKIKIKTKSSFLIKYINHYFSREGKH